MESRNGGLLAGKVAIVSGGGGGIGRGIVEVFSEQGATVVFADHDATRTAATSDAVARTTGIVGDVTEEATLQELFRAAQRCGGADILVNNVGHYGAARGEFHTQDRSEWSDLYRINLEHVLVASQLAIREWVQSRRPGVVVNISTIEAFRAIPTRAVYSAFKAAVTGLTKSLAVEYGHAGIRVNAIAPDVTETLQVPYSRWLKPGDEARIPTWVPVGRFGTPRDVANCALFLASDLSAFVSGTTVHADGGTLAAGGWFPTAEGGWTNRPRNP